MDVRDAEEHEIDVLTTIWHDGWNDAHAEILPAALKRVRTFERLRARLHEALRTVRVAGPSGAPVGFSMINGGCGGLRDEIADTGILAGEDTAPWQ